MSFEYWGAQWDTAGRFIGTAEEMKAWIKTIPTEAEAEAFKPLTRNDLETLLDEGLTPTDLSLVTGNEWQIAQILGAKLHEHGDSLGEVVEFCEAHEMRWAISDALDGWLHAAMPVGFTLGQINNGPWMIHPRS